MLLVDTNIWFETIDASNREYTPCTSLIAKNVGQLVVPTTVVAETAWLIEDRFGPDQEALFLRTVTNPRVATIAELTTADWQRTIELVEQYASMRLGTVDASIVAIAERLGSRPSQRSTSVISGS